MSNQFVTWYLPIMAGLLVAMAIEIFILKEKEIAKG
jgi:hypothetical protein